MAHAPAKMRHFPESDKQIQHSQTRYRAAKPIWSDSLLQNRQTCFLRDKSQQVIIAPIAENADADPRQKHQ